MHGAPPSLVQEAQRVAAQDDLVMHVRQLEKQAREVIRLLESHRDVERQALVWGRALLKFGCMALVSAIKRENFF
jgi:hypothetical protein